MRRRLTMLVAVLGLCATAWAGDWFNNAISVTDTSQTITFAEPVRAVQTINEGANEVFVCLFEQGETAVACTSATGRKVPAGGAKTWGPNGQVRYSALSIICSTGETASVIGDSVTGDSGVYP